jgi:hypothetical protein
MIKNYSDFIKEGILTKGKQLLNYKSVKENDKIAQKYINMIYVDWEKNKNLLKVGIRRANDSDNMELEYRITDKDTLAFTGNRDKGDILIKVSLVPSNYHNDISGARIFVNTFIPYKGELPLFGREMGTNKTIVDESGIKEDVYDYLNISEGPVKKLINFFKSKFHEKYPQLRTSGNLSYLTVLPIDNELRESREKVHKEEREKEEKEFLKRKDEATKMLSDNIQYSSEEIEDYFIELIDEGRKIDIIPIYVKDGIIYYQKNYSSLGITSVNQIKLDEIDEELKDGNIYYAISIHVEIEQVTDDTTELEYPKYVPLNMEHVDDALNMMKSDFEVIVKTKNPITSLPKSSLGKRLIISHNSSLFILIRQK